MCLIEDRAALSYLYTSGTTSAPKGVVSSHLAVYLESLGTAVDAGITHADRLLAMMPMFHAAQLNAFCTPAIAVGASISVMRGFDASAVLDRVEQESLSVVFGLPMMYRALVEEQQRRPRDVSSLRLAVYAMAPMPDQALPQGEAGEIVYRSPQAFTGYLHNEKATREALRGGWFHSGDMGYFDADGILWFVDRYKDVIKSGGENVASIEVEKALYSVEPGIAEAELLQRLRGRLSPYKCPKSVIFVESLPKTATGKIQKAELRKRYAAHFSGQPAGG